MIPIIYVAAHLLTLTGPDGQVIFLDPEKITTLRVPRGKGHIDEDIHCMVFTVDGKNINVVETCEQVRKLLNDSNLPGK